MRNLKEANDRTKPKQTTVNKIIYKSIDPEIKNTAVLEENIKFLIKKSKDSGFPVTQYFLEQALESLINIEMK